MSDVPPDERALLAAAAAHPADDLPRLAYADWLDEHGQSDPAEFVRVGVELARLPMRHPPTDARATDLGRRAFHLTRRLGPWESRLKSLLPKGRAVALGFRRGLPAVLGCPVGYFAAHADAALDTLPIEAVRFRRPTERTIAGLADVAAWRRVWDVGFSADDIDPGTFDRFLPLPFAHVEVLSVTGGFGHPNADPPAAWAERSAWVGAALGTSGRLRRVRVIDLSHAGLGLFGAHSLTMSDELDRLERLFVIGNHLSADAAAVLRERFGRRVFVDHPDLAGVPHGEYDG